MEGGRAEKDQPTLAPRRPADPTLTVREQFLVEITGDPGETGRRHVTSIGELNRLFTAWTDTVYHRRGHSETGQAPLQRWADGWAGAAPPLPDPAQLHEAFLWSEYRTVRKTATVSLHGNTYQVDPSLAGRRVELVFDPFDLTSIEVRWQGEPGRAGGPARHRPPRPPQGPPRAACPARSRRPASTTSALIDAAHDTRLAGAAISFAGLADAGQLPGQLTIDEALAIQENAVSIEKLQAHYGFTKMPFRRDLAPGMLHRHGAHAEAAARISWCISEHALGVITGEVGAGKTVALRAALASLDPSRHTLIYLGNPSVGVRGINHAIVAALGGVPKTHHATLTPQAMDLLAREHAERGRIPVLAIDEAHMLEPAQLEAVRMLTNHDLDSACPLACLLIGQPTLRRRIKLGILAALDQRIAVRYTMPGMTGEETASYVTPPPQARRPVRPAVQRRRHHPHPRHQPRPAPRRQQPGHPGTHRRLRRPQSHRRRIQQPCRSRRGHGRQVSGRLSGKWRSRGLVQR